MSNKKVALELVKIAKLISADAQSDYKKLKTKAEESLKKLNKNLKNHEQQFNEDNLNYGYIGDLSYVVKELENITQFLENV